MLNTKLTIHDIQDVEAFATHAVKQAGITDYGYLDQEDLITDCITYIWELSQNGKYDPALGSFAHTAGARLNRYIIDWQRTQYRTRWVFKDRIHERTPPTIVPLDGLTDYRIGNSRSRNKRCEYADLNGYLDTPTDQLQDLLGIHRTRNQHHPRPTPTHHPPPTRAAA